MMEKDLALQCLNVTKRFGSTLAVSDLNLGIPQGEIFGFIGPNGAGKTTTIKLIAGLLRPTSGRILILGQDLGTNARHAKQLTGFIPDDPFLYEALSAREFLTFVGGLYDLQGETLSERIEHFFDLLSMREWGDLPSEEYSHGMRQKVVIASALLHEPRLIVVDEPMVGLDPQSIRLVKDLFREKSRQGVTVFISTHTLSIAEEICDRVGIIHRGALLFQGSLDDLRRRYDGGEKGLEELYLNLTASSKDQARLPSRAL